MAIKGFIFEFWKFGLKQAYCSIFGGYILLIMIVTNFWYPIESIKRYDFIFIAAVVFQIFLLIFKFETLKEALVIFVFHIVATVMEVFKTSVGSWSYPGEFVIGIGMVPLFAGFMYSSIGSYISRCWRLFDFHYSGYPPKKWTILLVVLIYINFFSHHYIFDFRYILLLFSFALFGRITLYYKIIKTHRSMPLVLGWFLVALFIWFAENIATYTKIWLYPSQMGQWHHVPVSKLLAWYLLMLLSFVLVSLINNTQLKDSKTV